MSWLNELITQHEEFESPKAFWYWSALAAISATVKDNIWFDKFLYKLYPNIYVMLHADSGMRKGPPISMAAQLVKHADKHANIIKGRASIQGILKRLGRTETQPDGKIQKKSIAFICSSELTSSIVEDKAASRIFTDLYDRHYNQGEWQSLLKMEEFTIKDATVTMLTGTNGAMIEDFFTKMEFHGGYFARTFIIYEKEPQTINSLMFAPKTIPDYARSAEYLKELGKMHGEMVMSLEDRTYFNEWYIKFRSDLAKAGIKDETGTLARYDDTVLKVAMLISLGHNPALVITRRALDEALEHCEKLIGNIRQATIASGRSTYIHQKSLLIRELIGRPNRMISRAQLYSKYWAHANMKEWIEITNEMEEAGTIRIDNSGANVLYVMNEEEAQKWIAHFKGK